MSGKRQKIRAADLAFGTEDRGEAPKLVGEGTEPHMAKREHRKPGRRRTVDGGGVRAREPRAERGSEFEETKVVQAWTG